MTVKRIVSNIATAAQGATPADAQTFYRDILGLDLLMDHGWIVTYGSDQPMAVQISFASEGGAGTPVPDLSIEVDDVDHLYQKMKAADFTIEYDLTDEPWGVRRFYVRDPFGKLINILSHNS
ncbi:VOC family protein [Kiloniella laminariae]|uniref:VOC family protein n=1 Tax=Kiloniella laminariae TaxID=454162 RepID=UPI00036B220E|nr:VOC family protein [Kiloniella laminariae]